MVSKAFRMASTAALSAASASPRPIHRPTERAAASVTRTNSNARFLSMGDLLGGFYHGCEAMQTGRSFRGLGLGGEGSPSFATTGTLRLTEPTCSRSWWRERSERAPRSVTKNSRKGRRFDYPSPLPMGGWRDLVFVNKDARSPKTVTERKRPLGRLAVGPICLARAAPCRVEPWVGRTR
jgi:hypothetical protein